MGEPETKLSAPPPSFTPAGEDRVVRFGRYEIIGELAAGGMGTVYLARVAAEAGFQRLFAIKIMHEHLARDRAFVDMLLDEARLTSRIHHPNVVPIVDLGKDQGRYFLVMDYVEGCSLAQLAVRHPTERDPSKLVPLVLDALEGLHAAHTLVDEDDQPLHLVHRDVSLQNIMVGVDGAGRVVDFGIAKAEARIGSTRPGMLKGKLALMSPEQLKGGTVDARSDVFSAGAVLWSLLTGTRLFRGDSESATVHNILHKDIPAPSTVGLRPPECFDAVCLKALARDPEERYPSAADMAQELRAAAAANRQLATRSAIAAWVKESFAEEFGARRDAIRQRASAINVTIADVADVPVLPTLGNTTSPSLSGSGIRGASAIEATEALPAPTPAVHAPVWTRARMLAAIAALVASSTATTAVVWQRHEAPAMAAVVPAPTPIIVVSAQPAIVAAPTAAPAPPPPATTPAEPPRTTPLATAHAWAAPKPTAPLSTTAAKPAAPPPAPAAKEPASWDLDSPQPPQ